ncbi:SURF1-like protein [Rhodovastum atsumiense]|uniref:SURF1-like protein n=1 Tax=Rhodovastum atsumiense TaxID=504468 RepID=A0A5M6IXY4_9PROT|nr:SURF1 family protein [Rhodovastum atsumiense]KAA5613216.1 SURF1 family protein [Rhodovastum atsumiense]CAH2600630.1 SURF1-like protein [Rhodovastum atsumiense]
MSGAVRPGPRRLLVPGLMTAGMLAVLIGLGVWQLQRLAWKRDLLARLDAAEAAAPVPLPATPGPLQKVRAEGDWLDGPVAWYGSAVHVLSGGPVLGSDLIAPLRLPDGAVLLVDRGWMPAGQEPGLSPGRATVTGWLRPAERPGLFSARDDPAAGRFYTLDPQAMARTLGVAPVLPFVLIELADAGPAAGTPIRPAHLPRPPNDHLGYALTWFGLAVALLVVFAAYALRRRTGEE